MRPGEPLRVVLAGQETAGVHTLRLLTEAGCDVRAVLSDPEPHGRGLDEAARSAGIAVLPGADVRTPALAERLRRDRVDLLLNVHSLHIVAPEVLDAPRLGAYNLHPGPLPEYAGLDAPSWALLDGRDRHAVTLHRMAAGIDTGPIAYTADLLITEDETGATLAARCVRLGLPLVADLVATLQAGRPVPAIAQDPGRRRYRGRRRPGENVVRWDGPARDVVALVRACDYHPWTSPWGAATSATAGGRPVTVLRAATTGIPADAPPGTVGTAGALGVPVAAADEWVLVRRLRVDGLRTTPATALRAGERLVVPAGAALPAGAIPTTAPPTTGAGA
ncbi:formyltransferase family protein [Pseudonocardia nematodicida]|uniref:Formyltransferase family protein n=1 Tax=Pseudonocardia nematodicida TaxID=1206997 RepID=A0ABV1K3S4_9PSEU